MRPASTGFHSGARLDGEPLVLVSGSSLAAGAEYRTYRENFAKVLAKSGAGGALWFEARLPDGSTRRYGDTEDSRLDVTLLSRSGALVWSMSREEDAFGNAMTVAYHEDENAAVRQPREISYGNNGDAKLRFVYTARADTETATQGGAERTRHLLLHTVRAVLDGRAVREYRLLSETTSGGWRRLDKAQLCGYDEDGANPECLAALDVDWFDPANPVDGYKTCVSGVTDPLGRATTFEYGTVTATGTAGLFAERPFGEVGTPADAVAMRAGAGGAVKPVVTAVVRGDGVGGTARVAYAYQGRPYVGRRNWGLVGFAATRVTDATNGVVTYLQHRLDDPHFARLAAEHVYDGAYGGAGVKALSKRWTEWAAHPRTHAAGGATATTTVAHVASETTVRHEGGVALGATRTEWTHAFGADGLPTRTTETTTTGTGAEGAKGAGWGGVPSWTFTAKPRERKATRDIRNRTSGADWLVGFVCQATEAHHRNGAAAADRTLWTAYTPHGSTMAPASERLFGAKDADVCAGLANGAAPAGLALTTATAYDDNGNPTTRTVSGGGVASRTTTASAFSDARHPGAVANALGHRATFSHDARFGVPKSRTDANGRTTRRKLDPFGRVVEVTDPDGVVFATAYSRCGAGAPCAAVDGVAPAMSATTSSSPKITPTVTRYIDQLGRVVRVRTESFAGVHDILEDVRFDARGRVLRRGAPYFANATAPNTSYEYDVRDRVAKETRPDGGETAYAYAAGTGGATTVTATEKVYTGSTLSATITTATTRNLLGEVASVTEASGTSDAVTTAYTYDASGLPLTVTAGGVQVAAFVHDAAGNRTSATDPNSGATAFTHDALGQTLTSSNALGQTTTHAYDVLGRPVSRSDPDGKSFWEYDGTNGKGTLHRRCRGSTALTGCGGTPDFLETLAYGTDARPSSATTVIRADGQAARTYVRSYAYDSSGRLSTETHPSGVTTLREHNARGYLAAVRDNATKAVLERYTAADAFGSVTAVAHGNGATTARTFDADTGRATGVETTHGAGSSKTVAQDFGYAWRSDGTLASRTTGAGASKLTETFTRDPLRRLTGAAVSGAGGRSLTYGHDALGNLLSRTSSVDADKDVALSDHLSTATAAPGPHAPRFATAGGARRAVAWDAAGRMTGLTVCAAADGACAAKTGADHRFVTWNARNEATRVLVGDSSTDATPTVREDLARGPDGALHFRRTAWREDGAERVERRYVVGRFEEVVPASASSANEWVKKTLVTDSVLHVRVKPRAGNAVSRYEYPHRDHLGSVSAVTDAAGAASRQTAHDPYGARRAGDWTRAETAAERAAWADDDTRSTRGFSGHGQLDRTGLVDMGGRLYDPEMGIFLSPDPLVAEPFSAQGWNPYAYVGNRPLSRVDPTGFSFAPVGCNLGGVLCPGGGAGGASPGGASARTIRAVVTVSGVRRRRSVGVRWNFGTGFNDRGGFWNFDASLQSRPVPHAATSSVQVADGVDRQPADEPMRVLSLPLRGVVPVYTARGAIIWKNISAESSVDGDKHRYWIRGLICRGSTPGCDIELAKAVFDHINKNDVPFIDDDGPGEKNILGNPIDHLENSKARTSTNKTLKGHVFHPGKVIFTVPIDHRTGDIHVQIDGSGTGPRPQLNNVLGRGLFKLLIYRTMWEHMR